MTIPKMTNYEIMKLASLFYPEVCSGGYFLRFVSYYQHHEINILQRIVELNGDPRSRNIEKDRIILNSVEKAKGNEKLMRLLAKWT